MLAYALYMTDARIKAYVNSLERSGARVDVLVVREKGQRRVEQIGTTRVFHLTTQYRGSSPIRYILSYLKFFAASLLTLTYLATTNRYSAVHVHNMPNLLVFAAAVPRLLGTRLILDVHDLMPPSYMAKFSVDAGHPLVKCLVLEQRFAALMATHVFCADHAQKQYLESVCKVPSTKISVILNLPNEDLFIRSVGPTRSSERFELVYHGTIARRLGIDILLEAIAMVPVDIPVRLSIYGSGDYLPEALAIAQRLELGERVRFSRSFFRVEMIPQMIGCMDVGIVGNRRTLACDKFMLPVKLLEYVYLGLPVVAPRLTIIKSYFDEQMLKYYEPESASDLARCIVELYRSREERERLQRNAATFYANHSWTRQEHTYLGVVTGATGS